MKLNQEEVKYYAVLWKTELRILEHSTWDVAFRLPISTLASALLLENDHF